MKWKRFQGGDSVPEEISKIRFLTQANNMELAFLL
jgi:hypothetical protein